VITAAKLFTKETMAQKVIAFLTCKKSEKSIEQEIFGQELTLQQAIDPDSVLWENLSFTSGSSGQRKNILKLAAFLVSFMTILSGIMVDA
jgi:hypothetical protein